DRFPLADREAHVAQRPVSVVSQAAAARHPFREARSLRRIDAEVLADPIGDDGGRHSSSTMSRPRRRETTRPPSKEPTIQPTAGSNIDQSGHRPAYTTSRCAMITSYSGFHRRIPRYASGTTSGGYTIGVSQNQSWSTTFVAWPTSRR